MPSDPTWPDQARRIVNRLNTACGHRAVRIDHIGSTAVPGLDAKDVIDVQVTVASLDVADELRRRTAGRRAIRGIAITDVAKTDARSTVAEFDHTDDPALWHKRFHASADPGRPTNVHLRVDGWPNQQFALLFRDWLIADAGRAGGVPGAQARRGGRGPRDDGRLRRRQGAVVRRRLSPGWEWADATGWRP